MRRVVLLLLSVASACLAWSAVASAQDGAVVVADVRGPLDQRAIDFLTSSVLTPDAQVVVLQIDNPGIASGSAVELRRAIEAAPVPVVGWVGPSGAHAFGGVAQLLATLDMVGAAQGATIGHAVPFTAGTDEALIGDVADPTRLEVIGRIDGTVVVDESAVGSGLVDVVTATIGQFIAGLDGETVAGVVVETAQERALDDGSVVLEPSVPVRFVKPSLLTRTLRLAIRPESAFFFLVIGLLSAAFEFYAAGVGLTAGVALLFLALGGYGIAVLPVNWWAVVLTVAGLLLWTGDFQRNQIRWRAVAGTAALLVGGLQFTRAAPQFAPRWWAVLLTIAGAALFYVFALTTVVRARFSTRTIGREYLVGRTGVAQTGFDPEGYVDLDGGRWRARSHRAAGLAPGDAVEVLEVNGIVLEVGPVESVLPSDSS